MWDAMRHAISLTSLRWVFIYSPACWNAACSDSACVVRGGTEGQPACGVRIWLLVSQFLTLWNLLMQCRNPLGPWEVWNGWWDKLLILFSLFYYLAVLNFTSPFSARPTQHHATCSLSGYRFSSLHNRLPFPRFKVCLANETFGRKAETLHAREVDRRWRVAINS